MMDKFELFVRSLEGESVDFHIVGDANSNLLELTKKPHTKRLIDIMDIYQLKQMIQQPTRITENSGTLIDVFITNNPEKISY